MYGKFEQFRRAPHPTPHATSWCEERDNRGRAGDHSKDQKIGDVVRWLPEDGKAGKASVVGTENPRGASMPCRLGYLERARKKSSTTVTYRNMSETADQTNSLARIRGRKLEWRCRMKKAQFGPGLSMQNETHAVVELHKVVRKMVQGDLRTGIPARATRHATSSREERDKLQATRSGHSMITRTICCYWRRERQGETGQLYWVWKILGIAKNEITSGGELVDDDQEEDNNRQATGTILDDLC
ncbi:hypothetical protein B0H13DRAFT_1885737 [Mycena leptocephala]|nr:hypothetical protein B0H13DRAFT_1885737 [Mycena leptocephala]